MNESITVLLVDDHAVVREGYRRLLEDNGIRVCAEASTARPSGSGAAHSRYARGAESVSNGSRGLVGFHNRICPLWPVVASSHLDSLTDILACSESDSKVFVGKKTSLRAFD